MAVRPRLFIGSSTEGLEIAKAIQAGLQYSCEPELWTDADVFDVGDSTLAALAKRLPNFDFAVFVLSGDDQTTSRDATRSSPRDNVILELGISIGALGGDRTFAVQSRTQEVKLPTDMVGVITASFEPPEHGSWQSALRPACTAIEAAMKKLGVRSHSVATGHDGMRPASAEHGIVSLEKFLTSRTRFVDENFAIQALTRPVKLVRTQGRLHLTVDRREVSEILISDAGKKALAQQYVVGREDELFEKDLEIQRFIARGADGEMVVDLTAWNLRLRWASGGVLSIVRYRDHDYVPFFFRDIRPYGWNIALGSSERRVTEAGAGDPNEEWDPPFPFITREFLEETLVIDRDPAESPVTLRLLTADGVDTRASDRFAAEHVLQRRDEDGLDIQGGESAASVPVQFERANCDVHVIPEASLLGLRPLVSEGLLVCFSMLDLGIEVVRVARFALGDDDYMLDGEILRTGERHNKELVRMPIALFRCDYLARTFGNNNDWYRYTAGAMPSIAVGRPPSGLEVHLFTWDIKRRMEILQGRRCRRRPTNWQVNRFVDWYDKFGEYFVDHKTGEPSSSSLPRLFVPGTAKILNMYFSMPGVADRYRL